MTNEELNRRLRFCAEHGIAYSEKVWALLARAWEDGYKIGKSDGFADGKNWARRVGPKNPYNLVQMAGADQPAPTETAPQGAPPLCQYNPGTGEPCGRNAHYRVRQSGMLVCAQHHCTCCDDPITSGVVK